MGLFGTFGEGLSFAIANTVKKPLLWIGLAILVFLGVLTVMAVSWGPVAVTIFSVLTIIATFLFSGIMLKIYRNEEPDFANAGRSFVQGLLWVIITIIYMLIPAILFLVVGGASVLPMLTGTAVGEALGVGVGLVGIALAIVVAIIFALIMVPAEINFARKGFGAAFAFSDIFGMIKKVGWGKYILAWIVIIIASIIFGIILGILGLIGLIPVVGVIIDGVITSLLIVIFWIAMYKFWAILFADA